MNYLKITNDQPLDTLSNVVSPLIGVVFLFDLPLIGSRVHLLFPFVPLLMLFLLLLQLIPALLLTILACRFLAHY
jgi:hypothetical protein